MLTPLLSPGAPSAQPPHLTCFVYPIYPAPMHPQWLSAVFQLFPGSHAHLLPQLFFISIPFPPHPSFCLSASAPAIEMV